eukprot:TRINITY_DN7339_c0_g1_i1.p1 TRINITY_DN7339_c0_g1~~TRINITY_DN7339_c0_g1_i1.p1  ORF type:complete len:559 (+),score=145.49 TRINITY_DN7339_c0_g1_i1:65-1678(+)
MSGSSKVSKASASAVQPAAEAAAAKDFLKHCLGGKKDEDDLLGFEGDFFDFDEEGDKTEPEAAQGKGNGPVFMAMASDSECEEEDEDEDEDEDIEDAYNFDPEMVADLLKQKGFTMAELTEKFQDSMAQALERRLAEKSATADNQANDATRPDCHGDVDGRMTPDGCMTPPTHGPSSCQGSPDPSIVAERMERAKQEAINRRGRRSSAVKRDAIQEAMSQAVSRHRKSLVSQASKMEDQTPTKIQEAMTQAQRRHRLSISKAAETLDAAGLGEQDGQEVSEQLEMVQKAMEEARRRHRRSIAEAVEKVTGLSASATPFTPEPKMSASASPFQPQHQPQQQHAFQERINEAVSSAYRRQEQDVPPGFGGNAAYSQGAMNTWSNGSAAWSPSQSDCAAWSPQANYAAQNSPGYEQASPGYGQAYSDCRQQSYNQTEYGQLNYEQSSYEQSGYGQTWHGSYQNQGACSAPDQWQGDATASHGGWSGNGAQAGIYQGGMDSSYGAYDGGMTYRGEPGGYGKYNGSQEWAGQYPGNAAWGSA